MTSDLRSDGAEGGFTLIEVLIAMLILAVGLLGLEALGIGAARSIHRADEQSELTMTAARAMEDRILDIRRSPTAVGTAERCAADAASGHYVCSQVSTRAQEAALPVNAARVRVWVSPSQQDTSRFHLVSHVFDAQLP